LAGDLMTTVLHILDYFNVVTGVPSLAAYIEHCTARPVFKRALDARTGDFITDGRAPPTSVPQLP
jgi:glutathione S-transferase